MLPRLCKCLRGQNKRHCTSLLGKFLPVLHRASFSVAAFFAALLLFFTLATFQFPAPVGHSSWDISTVTRYSTFIRSLDTLHQYSHASGRQVRLCRSFAVLALGIIFR